MLERLFTSKTRVKLLTIFLLNPEKERYIRELTRMTKENINSIRRELSNLEEIGLFTSLRKGNTKYYMINKNMPLFHELTSIFLKTEGVAKTLCDHLSDIGSISLAFIYGSYAKGTTGIHSDIDVFIVGSVDEQKLTILMKNLEKSISREINYVVFESEEFHRRIKEKDPFIKNVLSEPKIFLIGGYP